MQISDAPGKIVVPFASSGSKNTIPVTSSGVPGSASFTGGFPDETMEPVTSGGVPPAGKDFNGTFFDLSAIDRWFSAGAAFLWDSAFSAAIGGYPKGARVLQAAGIGYWISLVDNNTTDPDTLGGGWFPQGAGTTSSVYASAQQTLATPSAKVIFDTIDFDSGMWDAANHRFKILYAGKYRINGAILLNAPDGQNMTTQIFKNGALAKNCFEAPQVSDGDLTLPFDAMLNLAINDYLEVFMGISQTNVLAGFVGSNQAYVYAQLEYLGS